jgi:hypothetical protein
MNPALVDQVVQAVLYEGYILYPYRATTRKNRQRFTFGRVYPEVYSLAQNGAEPSRMQTECLVEGAQPRVEITVRFLHPMAREIGIVDLPLEKLPDPEPPDFFHEVPELEVDGRLYQSWQEVVERKVEAPEGKLLSELARGPEIKVPFAFPASRTIEPIVDRNQKIAGVIVRRQAAIEGLIEIGAEPVGESVFRLTARILNQSPVPALELEDADAVVMRTFASTHTILHVTGGAFLSTIDPPENLSAATAACQNQGTWPVLVGDEKKQERDTMVSSPIILYDYPKIAPESPGDLFDGGEIDEILTLRIQTMTDAEKREMRGIDEQARRILERTEALDEKQLMKMHGLMRDTVAAETESFFNPASKPTSFSLGGVSLKAGDRVRVRPKNRADIFDMAVAGKIAVIETIEQDAEDKIHLALVMEDDPGKDLGFLRQPGHRFFYGLDEVEPLTEDA